MRVVGVRWGTIGRIGSIAPLGMLLVSTLLSGCAQSINITPVHPQVAAGTTVQLTATSINSDGQPQDVTSQVTWSSSNSAVASVGASGTAGGTVSGLTSGSVTIFARLPGAKGSTRFTVSPAALVSIQVTPAAPSLPDGLTEQFSATGVFADNSTQDLTQQVTWSSSSPTVAAVSNSPGSNGLASATGVGSTTITATSGSLSASATLTVSPATLVSIQVTPANPSTPKGLKQPFTATGIYSDNSIQNLTSQVSWSSSTASVATISNAAGFQGLASSLAPGSTTITATSGSLSGSTSFAVTAATLVSIALTPAHPSLPNGLSQQFSATGTYSDNSTQNLTTQVTWSSSDTSVASISNAAGSQGLASSAALGTTTITATSGGLSGSTDLMVIAASIDSNNIATYTNQSGAGGPYTFSYNVTVGSGDNYLIFLEANNSSDAPPLSVTYDGQALSMLGDQINSFFESSIWVLASPPAGTYSFEVNYTGTPPGSPWIRVLHTVVPCAGVTSVGTLGTNSGNGRGPQDLTVNAASSASNGFYLGIVQNYSSSGDGYGATSGAPISNGTGQTNLASLVINDSGTAYTYVDADQINSPDAGSFSWSTGDSELGWVAAAVAIN